MAFKDVVKKLLLANKVKQSQDCLAEGQTLAYFLVKAIHGNLRSIRETVTDHP
jgi:hypothetical protein